MAITADKSPYKLTAKGDDLASVFQGRDMLDTTPVVKFDCLSIRVYFGATGTCTLLDKPNGELIFQDTRDVGETSKFEPADYVWLDGCYVAELPADSVVFLYVK